MSSGLPAWLEPVADRAPHLTDRQMSRFLPPVDDPTLRQGAVLVLFADHDAGPGRRPGALLLTERAHHMRSHAGQVSFPGGSLDPGESVADAALREAHEETGLDPAAVRVFGELPQLWLPPSNFAVTPVLGHTSGLDDAHVASPDEVHAVHRVAIADLVDPAHRFTVRHPSGYVGPGFWIGEHRDVVLWGFTGGIISTLLDHLGWAEPWDADREHPVPDHMLRDHR